MKPLKFRKISPSRFRAEVGRISLNIRFKNPEGAPSKVLRIQRVLSRSLWRDDRKAKRQALAKFRAKVRKAKLLK